MRNILVATDLTVNCDRALERGIKLAKSLNATLHVLHITSAYFLPSKKKEAETLKQDKESLIRTYLSSYTGAKNIKAKIHVVEAGDTFTEIISFSQKIKADLVIMGTHEKEGFKDLFIGTTVERIIRKGLKPVLMVKDKPKGDYKNIVAGCDFSNSSKESFYLSLGISVNATINLIHACAFSNTSRGHQIEVYAGDIIENIEAAQLEKFVEKSAKALKKYNIPSKKLIYKTIKGSPQDVLISEVKKVKADLLAIGVHSRAGFINSKLGGVAEDILANPPCDILIAQGI